jgi:mono/diheme cytochrome c family protein
MSRIVKWALLLILVAGIASFMFLKSGVYDIGADDPHNRFTYWILKTLRDSSIEHRAGSVTLPPLNDPGLLIGGGQDYNEMCTGCHMKPGKSQNDMTRGLYPRPPDLTIPLYLHGAGKDPETKARLARRRFWVIKHGIKASGMPAWGLTHDDERIWAMVAFLQKLPELTAEQYQIITARRASDEGHH